MLGRRALEMVVRVIHVELGKCRRLKPFIVRRHGHDGTLGQQRIGSPFSKFRASLRNFAFIVFEDQKLPDDFGVMSAQLLFGSLDSLHVLAHEFKLAAQPVLRIAL